MDENKKISVDEEKVPLDDKQDDVMEQMKHYLTEVPEEMAREAEAYEAAHPEDPREAAARKARMFDRLRLSEEVQKAVEEEAVTAAPVPRKAAPFYRKKSFKILAAVAACLVVLISIPMVSQSARVAIRDVVLQVFGSGASSYTYDKTVPQPESEEETAWNEVAEKLDVPRLGFGERPEGLEFQKCAINETVLTATLSYKLEGKTIHVKIRKKISEDMSSVGMQSDNNMIDKIDISLLGQSTEIWEMDAEGVKEYHTVVQDKAGTYNISCEDDIEILKKFVSNLCFY